VQGFVCPRCQGWDASSFRHGRQPDRECTACGYPCSLIAGTLFENTKLPLTRWVMAVQLLSQAKNKVAALELMRQLGVSCPTAWLMKGQFPAALVPCRQHHAQQTRDRPERDLPRLQVREVRGTLLRRVAVPLQPA
jgi:hypothetical protein